jgi:PEP-CTERM motif-containing protein
MRSTGRWIPVLVVTVVLLFSWAIPASATISGTLLTGSGGTITYKETSITINTDPSSTPPGPPWNGEVANGTSLQFAGCSGILNSVGCLSATEAIEFAQNTPITAVLATNNPFILFAVHPNLQFTAAFIGPGSGNTNCAAAFNIGDSCSPFAGSPLLLTKTATGTEVSFGIGGTATDGAGSSVWLGQLESPFTGQTPVQLQNMLLAGGSVTSSQSGDFIASALTVPEPTTISLVGIGLLVLGRGLRKRIVR